MEGRYPAEKPIGRAHPASGVYIQLGQPTIVFLTVCTRQRKPWLAQGLVHRTLTHTWQEAQAWLVGYYLLMPDHLHLFCAPHDLAFTLDEWVTYWKRQFKRNLNATLGRVRLPPNPDQLPPDPDQLPPDPDQSNPSPERECQGSAEPHPPLVGDPNDYRWQEGKPWDTRLRRSENYQQKWRYVWENPVRAGLVQRAEDWPYQGMLNVLPW